MKPLFLLPFLMTACNRGVDCDNPQPQPTDDTTFEVVANPNSSESGFGEFSQYVDVFGLSIYGEEGVCTEHMLHAAHILAELLDNDENGEWDDPALFNKLLEEEVLVPIFAYEGSPAEDEFFHNYRGSGVSAVLWNNEMDPSQPGHWGADATIEEIMHTINHVGHVALYPDAFGLEPDSSRLTEAMDVARGGQWTSFPGSYPEEAWYHYDDRTCDYECMAIEYIYWAQVSHMGILNDPETCEGIANEWELCSPALLEEGDVLIHALITDSTYSLPQLAPDGDYTPSVQE